MTSAKRLLFCLIASLAVLTAGCAAGPNQGPSGPAAADCVEDDACWNCSTMGNHVCGPTR